MKTAKTGKFRLFSRLAPSFDTFAELNAHYRHRHIRSLRRSYAWHRILFP